MNLPLRCDVYRVVGRKLEDLLPCDNPVEREIRFNFASSVRGVAFHTLLHPSRVPGRLTWPTVRDAKGHIRVAAMTLVLNRITVLSSGSWIFAPSICEEGLGALRLGDFRRVGPSETASTVAPSEATSISSRMRNPAPPVVCSESGSLSSRMRNLAIPFYRWQQRNVTNVAAQRNVLD